MDIIPVLFRIFIEYFNIMKRAVFADSFILYLYSIGFSPKERGRKRFDKVSPLSYVLADFLFDACFLLKQILNLVPNLVINYHMISLLVINIFADDFLGFTTFCLKNCENVME